MPFQLLAYFFPNNDEENIIENPTIEKEIMTKNGKKWLSKIIINT